MNVQSPPLIVHFNHQSKTTIRGVSKTLDHSLCSVQVFKQRSEQYGPIYKETFGNISTIVISDLDEYDKVIAVDGRYPNRYEMQPITYYRTKRGMGLGIVNGSVSV